MGVISVENTNDSDHSSALFFVAIFVAVRPSLSNPDLQYNMMVVDNRRAVSNIVLSVISCCQ